MRAIYCESVGNPAGNIADISRLSDVAHKHRISLIVDNTAPGSVHSRRISFGADIVVRSLTKFIAGHGTTLNGIIMDGGRFRWADRPSGDPRSRARQPTSTTRRRNASEEKRKVGVAPETIRICLGIEHVNDIIRDFNQSIDAAIPGNGAWESHQ